MKEQVALVTGASSGIGEAIAVALKKNGYRVYAAARRLDRMKHLEDLGIYTLSMDVTDEASMTSAVKKIHEKHGMIDVLVNNAGYGSYGAFEEVPLSEGRRQLEVNLFGLARLSQMVIPEMRKARSGTIINISSVGGKFGEAFGTWYHTAKFAVEGFSDSLALELAPYNIRVIAIEPGAIKTEWSAIAADNLVKFSAKGNYAKAAKIKAKQLRGFNDLFIASNPEVIAKKVVKILSKKNPKLRYPVGGGATSLMLIRKLSSDKVFYKILQKVLG